MFSGWLRQLLVSTRAKGRLRVIVFIYLGMVFCPIRYWALAAYGDNTWISALNYAAVHHLAPGQDIVWTAGPIAWLAAPQDFGNNLSRAILFQTAVWILLLAILWDLCFRCNFPLKNLVLFAIFLAFSGTVYAVAVGLGDMLITAALLLLLQFRLRAGLARYVIAIAMLGLVPPMKFVGVMLVIGIVAGVVIDRIMDRAPGAGWQVLLAVVLPASVAALTWWLTVGSFHTLPAYLKGSLELSKGYSLAMSIVGPRWEFLAAAVTMIFLAIAFSLLWAQDRRITRFMALILAIPILISIKHGFVRQDAHVSIFFCFAAVALGLIALLIPLTEKRAMVAFAVITPVFAVIWYATTVRTLPRASFEGTGITTPWRVAQVLRFSHLRQTLNEKSRHNFPENLRLEPEIKAIIQQEPVASLSVSYNEAYLEGANLVLYPVLQRYSAYTPYLDELNAEWIRNKGPRFLIFDGAEADDRHPWTETPAMWLEVYRWYETRLLASHMLLLERRSKPRFTRLEEFAHSDMRFGHESSVPMAHDPLFWRLQCSLSTAGRLRALLFRIPEVTMELNDDNKEVFRVLPGVMVSPSAGGTLPTSLKDFAEVFAHDDRHRYAVYSLTFAGPGASAYNPGCDVEWIRLVP